MVREKLETLLTEGKITQEQYEFLSELKKERMEKDSIQKSDQDKLRHLLAEKAVTFDEYILLSQRQHKERPLSTGKKIVSVILTLLAIGAVLWGTCILNVAIVSSTEAWELIAPLSIIWIAFPIFLIIRIARRTKSASVKAGIKGALIIIGFLLLWSLILGAMF
ncbi:MAG: hypothetical protein J6Y03_05175 [Alphaproteobacteria bacterium]|nr:hypothetical protein [Alphaproteobacteria bacterium]